MAEKPIDRLKKMFEGVADGVNLERMFEAFRPQVVTCKACQVKNRLKPGHEKPRCGKCGLPL